MKQRQQQFNRYLKDHTALPPIEVDHILDHFVAQFTKRNEILVNYGEICHYYYFINEGIVRNYTINTEGTEISRYFAFANMFTTALPSFIAQKPTFEYLQSIQPAHLLVCPRKDFYMLLQEHPELDKLYRRILEKRFITSQKLIYEFQGFSATKRVQWLFKNEPDLLLQVSNKMVASYLGISPSTLSRIKAKL